jgi:PTS system nitrogen regulatory IIA component
MLGYVAAADTMAPRSNAPGAPHRTVLSTVLQPGDVLLDLDVATKNLAFQKIALFVAHRHGVAFEDVYDGLIKREKIGSTGLGFGIAIPHARIKGLATPVAAYIRTQLPIPYDAPDFRPVSDMLVSLVPEVATDEHLQLLAEVADLFCDRSLRERLRSCGDPAAAYAMLTRT